MVHEYKSIKFHLCVKPFEILNPLIDLLCFIEFLLVKANLVEET